MKHVVGRVVLAAAALISSAAAHADAYAAALLPLMAPDLLEPQKRAIDERIRAIAADNAVSVQPGAETARNIDKAKKAGAACNLESLACQAQMGVLLGAKQVIIARVTSDWAGDRLELRLLDALRGTTIREAAQLLPKDGDLRTRVADGVILSVLAPGKTGAVALTTGDLSGGAAVFLDSVPLKAVADKDGKSHIEGLAPGPHDLELRAEGHPTVGKRVVVVSGELVSAVLGAPKAAAAVASNIVTPPTVKPDQGPSTGVWLVGGGAALAAAAGASAGGIQAAMEYSVMERSQRSALQVTGLGLLGATAVGVVVAGAGGVMIAMDQGP